MNVAAHVQHLCATTTVGNTVSNLTGPRFEPLTSHFREKRVTVNDLADFRRFTRQNNEYPEGGNGGFLCSIECS